MSDYSWRHSRERYMHDPMFAAVVKSMLALIEQHGLTPAEVRDAATTASLIWARENVEPIHLRKMLD